MRSAEFRRTHRKAIRPEDNRPADSAHPRSGEMQRVRLRLAAEFACTAPRRLLPSRSGHSIRRFPFLGLRGDASPLRWR